MKLKIPDGYRPVTLAWLETINPILIHNLFVHVGDEWLLTLEGTKEELAKEGLPPKSVVKAKEVAILMEETGQIQFAIAPNGEPALFSAAKADFQSEFESMLAEKLVSFWDVQGDYNPKTGETEVRSEPQPLKPSLPYTVLQPLHWEVALHRQMEAINSLKFIEKLPPDYEFPPHIHIDWNDLNDEVKALRVAQVYSFSGETMHAIMEAAESIPHEAPLSSIEVPRERAGWFWFSEPYPIAASPIMSGNTAALLWSWDTRNGESLLRFSAYVIDDGTALPQSGLAPAFKLGTKGVVPSTKWTWPVGHSFHDMIGINSVMYDHTYRPGSRFANQPHLIGKKATLSVVSELSLFFMQACLWFRQTVPGTKRKIDPQLTQTDENIGRHVRKKYQKELKSDKPPTVRVVALRKTAVEPREHTVTAADGTRHLHVRFVVRGHSRLQACGPEFKDRKLVWVSAYVKGKPEDPFKESGPKVYAVVR